jgi:hypothetical protein
MKLQPQPALSKVDWQLSRISTKGRKRSKLLPVQSDSPLSATFVDAGVVFGETGVTTFDATYDAGGSSIGIDRPTPSGQTCEGRNRNKPACRLQATYLSYLAAADQYIVKEDMLRLYQGTRSLLEFVPSTSVVADETDEDGVALTDG